MIADNLHSRKFSPIQILSTLILFAALLFYIISIAASGKSSVVTSVIVVLGMLLNGGIAVFFIVADVRGISLAKAHWYFVLIFLCIAPLAQYSTGYYAWNYKLPTNTMIAANGIITLWCIFFACVYSFVIRNKRGKEQVGIKSYARFTELPSSMFFDVALVIFSLLIFIYLVNRYGFTEMASQRVSYGTLATSWADWIMSYALPAVPALGCCHCLLLAKEKHMWFVPALVLFIITLFCVNPIYSSRYSVSAAYLPILLALLPKNALRNRSFDVVILVAVIIVFPMMNAFKTMTIDQVTFGYLFDNFAGSYRSIDFDAYSMIVRSLQYVDSFGLSMGAQLMSSLFYGLPSMAAKVNVATGELVSGTQGASYTNLSAPLQAEAYVDFGVIGVIVYAILFALIFGLLDYSFWSKSKNTFSSFRTIVFFVLVAFSFYLMRGALQPVIFRMWTLLLPLGLLYLGCRLQSFARSKRLHP